MTISRSWTPLDGDERWNSENYYDKVKAQCDGLMKWWSQLQTEIENESFHRQFDYENGHEGYNPFDGISRRFYDTEEEYQADLQQAEAELKMYTDAVNETRAMRESQLDYIEMQLTALGARIMRPYEHWNEDETYMAYMERDR